MGLEAIHVIVEMAKRIVLQESTELQGRGCPLVRGPQGREEAGAATSWEGWPLLGTCCAN